MSDNEAESLDFSVWVWIGILIFILHGCASTKNNRKIEKLEEKVESLETSLAIMLGQ